MKLSVEDKINRKMPLNIGELCEATGYSRSAIKKIKPPLVAGKIRLDAFWKHVESIQSSLTGPHVRVKTERPGIIDEMARSLLAA